MLRYNAVLISFALAVLPPAAGWAQAPSVLSPPNNERPSFNPPNLRSLDELAAVIAERDRQYAQRFEAQQKAVDAALAAQTTATAAAFAAAEKAVAAALAAQEKATAAAFAAANTAVIKAETANEKRLDSVNEFRAQLKDQASLLITRNEVDTRFKAQGDKLDILQSTVTGIQSRTEGAAATWGLLLAAIGAMCLIFGAIAAFYGMWSGRRREPQPMINYVPAPTDAAPAPVVAPRR